MATQHHLTTLGATLSALLLSVSPVQADPPAGVHHDALRGYWSFDLISTTEAPDLSGLGHHAELRSPLEATPGYFGSGALGFGGTGYSLMTLANDSHQIVGANQAPFSISFWFWVDFNSYNAPMCSLLQNDDASLIIVAADRVADKHIYTGDFVNGTFVESSTAIELETWHHIAVTYDGTDLTLYFDGVLDASTTGVVDVSDADLWSSLDFLHANQVWGELDELRIHAEALTPQEVAALYALVDTDGNGIDDNWEEYYFETIGIDPDADADGDGLSNRAEYLASTDPTNPDTDGDGMSDGWEATHGLNPRSDTDADADPDGDGYTNAQEYRLGRNPNRPAIPDTTGLVNLVVNRPL